MNKITKFVISGKPNWVRRICFIIYGHYCIIENVFTRKANKPTKELLKELWACM